MSLDRKDVRAKLDADLHAQLRAICDVDGVDMGVFIENLLVPVIQKRVTDANVLAGQFPRAGITGSGRESAKKPAARGFD